MARATIRSSKWRSFLTMLGIIIGVVSVVTVVSIGEGIKHQVGSQIDQLGRDLITVRPGQLVKRDASGGVSGVNLFQGVSDLGSLSSDDLAQIQKTRGVRTAVPLSLVNGHVSVEGKQASQLVLSTTANFPKVITNSVAYGSFFPNDVSQNPNVAVIGNDVAQKLFGQRTPVGRSFQFLGQKFYVHGVLKKFDTSPLSLSTDMNNTIFIPQSTAQTLTSDNTQLYQVLAKPKEAKQTDEVVNAITTNLRTAHQGQQQFTVLRQDESLSITNNILDLLTRLITGVAAVSLLVGGIGIMNVMLVSVAERMHEIGLRKALGATNRQILLQFLTESAVLSFMGGVIGVIASLVLSFVLSTLTSLSPVINWQVVILATLVSLVIGVLFGTAPALKAARKDPIEALRNE